jgi:transposase
VIGKMAKELVSDELWAVIQPLLPPPKPKPKGGRPPIPDRKVLTGILFVLMTGIPWEMLPKEMGCGSGMTCWRRLRSWQQAGVWKRLHKVLLDRLGEAENIDWSRASLDSATVPAPGGAKRPGRILRIAANRARSAILWSTRTGSRWPLRSRQPMSMTSR